MTRALPAIVLLASCGAAPAIVDARFALDSVLASRIVDLQVAFVPAATGPDCTALQKTCLASQGLKLEAVGGHTAGHLVVTTNAGSVTGDVEAPIGTFHVVVEGLDASGHLVANACRLRLDFAAGRVVESIFTLQEYTGATCAGALP